MSRIVSETRTLTAIPSGYSTSNSSYSSISSSYPVTNGYTNSSSTSYAYITCITGSQAETYISYTFDIDDIPSGATITNVTCLVKSRVSSTSYISTAVAQLYSNTTAKGTSTSYRSTTASARTVSGGSSWTVSEVQNVQIRCTATRGTSNTTRSAYIYFYGADLTITYTIEGTMYTVTASSDVSGITVSPSEEEYFEDSSAEVDIIGTLGSAKVMDNGIDVTSQLTQLSGDTISAVAEDLDTGFSSSDANFYMSSSSTGTTYLEYAVGHTAESPGSTNTNNTYVKDGGNNTSTGWAIYNFDFSSIPVGATINSVSVKCYGAREDSTIDSTHVAQLATYCGTTLKGTAQNFTSTSNSIVTLSDIGTWTREDLQSAKLRFTLGYYGGRLMGITWSVTYTISGYSYTINNIAADHTIVVTTLSEDKIYIKVNGTWKQASNLYTKINGSWVSIQKIYKKISGTWTAQSDKSSLFDNNIIYING